MAKKKASESKRRYKGGAQKRREKKAKLEAEARARAALTGEPHPTDKFRELGPPPDDVVGGVAYANRVAALLLYDILTDKAMGSEVERRRLAKEFIGVIGMTAVKALYEQRLKRLEAKVYGKGQSDEDDTDGLEEEEP